MKKIFFLILLLQIPLILPFFHKGFFPGHDDVQVTRIFEMVQSLKFGDVPPRWSANLLFGRGYPLYIFYGILPYLIGSFLVFSGLNFLLATKAVFILSFFMGSIGVYFLVKQLFGKVPALVSSVAFSYAPYRALDVYVRGNLAEFFSFSLFPWVFWINYLLLVEQKQKKVTKLVYIFAVLLFFQELSHNLSCFIFFLFLLIFDFLYIILYRKKDSLVIIFRLIKSFLISFCLSAFYLVPLFIESKYVIVGKFFSSPYWNYFLTLKKIWYTPWGWNGYIEIEPMSLQLGKFLIIFAFVCFFINQIVRTKYRKLINIFFIFTVFFSFLEIKESLVFWRMFKVFSFLQFPWRFHILTTLIASLLSGAVVFLLKTKFIFLEKKIYLLFFLAILMSSLFIGENLNFFKPRYYWNPSFVSETTTWDDEYLPKWVKVKPKTYADKKVEVVVGSSVISEISWGYLQKKFTATSEAESRLQIAHIYYPGWHVYVNGVKKAIDYDNDYGLMTVFVPQGKSEVIFSFERTWWRTVSETVSLFGFLVFIPLSLKTFLSKSK